MTQSMELGEGIWNWRASQNKVQRVDIQLDFSGNQ